MVGDPVKGSNVFLLEHDIMKERLNPRASWVQGMVRQVEGAECFCVRRLLGRLAEVFGVDAGGAG